MPSFAKCLSFAREAFYHVLLKFTFVMRVQTEWSRRKWMFVVHLITSSLARLALELRYYIGSPNSSAGKGLSLITQCQTQAIVLGGRGVRLVPALSPLACILSAPSPGNLYSNSFYTLALRLQALKVSQFTVTPAERCEISSELGRSNLGSSRLDCMSSCREVTYVPSDLLRLKLVQNTEPGRRDQERGGGVWLS